MEEIKKQNAAEEPVSADEAILDAATEGATSEETEDVSVAEDTPVTEDASAETPAETKKKGGKRGLIFGIFSIAAGVAALPSAGALAIAYFATFLLDCFLLRGMDTFFYFVAYVGVLPTDEELILMHGGWWRYLFGAQPLADSVMFVLTIGFVLCGLAALLFARLSRSKETFRMSKTAKAGSVLAVFGLAGCLTAVIIPTLRLIVYVLCNVISALIDVTA